MRLAWIACAAICSTACGGSSWSLPLPSLDRLPLSVYAFEPRDVFVAGGPLGSPGNGLALHFDGIAWTQLETGTTSTLWWVWGESPTSVYFAGEHGIILHFDGARLQPMVSGSSDTLYGIWGGSPDDIWAVGGVPDVSGTILHFDGNNWQPVPAPTTTGAYFKVWGTATNDVFFCGQGGTIVHWDGASFARQPTGLPSSETLFTVAGRASNDVYAVGGLGSAVALHYDGASWQPVADVALVRAGPLAGVAVDADGTVLFVGAGGVVLRGKAGALDDESRAVTDADLHGAALVHGQGFAVGGNYLVPAPAPRHGVLAHYGDPIAGALR